MRFLSGFLLFFVGITSYSQPSKDSATTMIEEFFKAFHEQDSVKLKSFAFKEVQIKSIGKIESGEIVVNTDNYENFVSSISSIPAEVNFEERLGNLTVNTDGYLANVWMPYEFYINGDFSHCGVNNFQLISTKKGWKIFSIVDTRKKEACKH